VDPGSSQGTEELAQFADDGVVAFGGGSFAVLVAGVGKLSVSRGIVVFGAGGVAPVEA